MYRLSIILNRDFCVYSLSLSLPRVLCSSKLSSKPVFLFLFSGLLLCFRTPFFLETYEKKVASTKIYMIRRLYNLRMKESDLVQAHLNEYKSLSSQISSQVKTIEDELRAMILMSSLPSSSETFFTTVCNASTTAIKYSEVTSTILTEAKTR